MCPILRWPASRGRPRGLAMKCVEHSCRMFALLSSMALLVILTACPEDDVASTDDDGTAGTTGPGEAEPIDPLDGEGSDPPGEPDPTLTWRAPTTLGNGLVHDTRYD